MRHPQVYLDHNATTALDPLVLEAMLPWLAQQWGNPSSAYQFATQAAHKVKEARAAVASLIGADPGELVFTSGGTESNNAALHSAVTLQPARKHIVTTAVEHAAVLEYTRYLEARGFEISRLPVDSNGLLQPEAVKAAIRPDTALVTVMWANNETGILFPVPEIAEICRSKGVLFHTDAVQAAGKISLDLKAVGVHMLSVAAHKIHGPKGVGCLFVRRGTPFQPYLMGGHQEGGRRAGTENVAAIAGFARAAELALQRLPDEQTTLRRLRDLLEKRILQEIPAVFRNGASEPRLPNTSNVSFSGIEAESILIQLDREGICASSGSACTTGSLAPSHVLMAMGLGTSRARSAIRFSLGRGNTVEDVNYTAQQVRLIIERLRAISPLAEGG